MTRRPSQPRPGLAAKSRGTPARGRPPRPGGSAGEGLGAAAIGSDFADAADATEVGVISSDLRLEPDPTDRGRAAFLSADPVREVELGAADTLIRSPPRDVAPPPAKPRLTLPKPADLDPSPTAPPALRLPKPAPEPVASGVSVSGVSMDAAAPSAVDEATPRRPERLLDPIAPPGLDALGQTLDRIQASAGSGPPQIPKFDSRFVMRQLEEDVSPPIPFTLRELLLTVGFFVLLLTAGVLKGPSLGIMSPEESEQRQREHQQRVLRERLREEADAERAAKERARRAQQKKFEERRGRQKAPSEGAPMEPLPPIEPPPELVQTEGTDEASPSELIPPADLETADPETGVDEEGARELAPEAAAAAALPPQVEVSGLVTILSEPAGAILVINGRVMGRTPFIKKVEGLDGRIAVELKRKGYRTWKRKLSLNEAGHYHLKATLKKR